MRNGKRWTVHPFLSVEGALFATFLLLIAFTAIFSVAITPFVDTRTVDPVNIIRVAALLALIPSIAVATYFYKP